MFSQVVGRAMRGVGQTLERVGVSLQGRNGYVEKLVTSTRVVSVGDKTLKHGLEAFVAPTANVVGAVTLGERASVWYGATVRGEGGNVVVGNGSCLQDRSVVDASRGKVTIGNDVSIGACAYVGAATFGNGVLVGPGATVLDGATIGNDSYVDGGAVVEAGTRIPAGELWTGSPAKKLRSLTEGEIAFLRSSAMHTAQSADQHFQQTILTGSQLEEQTEEALFRKGEFLQWNDDLPRENEVLEQYNRLSYNPDDVAMFRAQDYDEPAEWAAVDAEDDRKEDVADAEAAEFARTDRVNDAVEQLLAADIHRHPIILAQLRDRDPAAADELEEAMRLATEAATSDEAAANLEAQLKALNPAFARPAADA